MREWRGWRRKFPKEEAVVEVATVGLPNDVLSFGFGLLRGDFFGCIKDLGIAVVEAGLPTNTTLTGGCNAGGDSIKGLCIARELGDNPAQADRGGLSMVLRTEAKTKLAANGSLDFALSLTVSEEADGGDR